ncbi:MAG: hypothetical protein ACRETI_10115 [Steroidobacteraceae bacterium]
MKRLLVLILAGVASAATAQEGNPGAMPDPTQDPMLAAMLAEAAKPGDDALTCDQLQAELGAMGTDPQVQAVMQEQGAYAQEQMAKMQGAQQQAEAAQSSRPPIAGQMFMGFLSSFIPPNPVTGYAQQAAAAAQNAKATAEAQKNQQDMMDNMQKVMGIMPQLMRGAHVAQLAQAKGCDFMAGEPPAQ